MNDRRTLADLLGVLDNTLTAVLAGKIENGRAALINQNVAQQRQLVALALRMAVLGAKSKTLTLVGQASLLPAPAPKKREKSGK